MQRVAQACRDDLGVLAVVHGRQQHSELVPAEAGERVPVAHHVAEPQRDLAQQLVAVRMAERVVDLLEAVEVDEEDSDLPVAALRHRERAFEPFLEQDAVRQAGQRVMRGLTAQPARRQQHDAIERRPQQQQAAGDHAVHRARVSRDLRLDRGVREVDLIDADGLAAGAEAQRDVDLQRARALVLVVDAVHEVRDDFAGERVLDAFDAGGAVADELVPVGPDHPRTGVEDLDALDARVPQHARPHPAVELRDPLRRHPVAHIRHRQVRLHTGTGHQLGDVLRAGQRSRLDLALQDVSEGDGQHGERHNTQHAEAGEQRPS